MPDITYPPAADGNELDDLIECSTNFLDRVPADLAGEFDAYYGPDDRQAFLMGYPTGSRERPAMIGGVPFVGESLREARERGHEQGQRYVETGICDHCEDRS